MSGDAAMIDHVRRSALPESDPDYYDIHSNVTVGAFGLACEPTKAGLKAGGKADLRTVAKSIIFGLAFGAAQGHFPSRTRGGDRRHGRGGAVVKDTIFKTYPGLEPYFAACRARVKFPRWLQNSFGAYRRFPRAANLRELGGYEREAMNFPVQSLVADAMSRRHSMNWSNTASGSRLRSWIIVWSCRSMTRCYSKCQRRTCGE